MTLIRVGVDLAKSVMQVHGVDSSKTAVWSRLLGRSDGLKVPAQTVGFPCRSPAIWRMRVQRPVQSAQHEP